MWKKITESVSTISAIIEIGKIIAILGASGSLSGLFSILAIEKFGLEKYSVLIYIFVISSTLFITLYIYKKLNKYQPVHDKENPDFEILLKESVLSFQNDENIIFTKRMTLKALRDNLESYQGEYAWTGDKEYTVENKIHGHVFEKTDKTSVYQCYKIIFDRSLKKDEEIKIEVDWTLTDKENKMSPLVGSIISEPTDKLVLEVCFSKEDGRNKKVFNEIFSHAGANYVLETNLMHIDSGGKVRWEIPKPKLLHVYRLRWIP